MTDKISFELFTVIIIYLVLWQNYGVIIFSPMYRLPCSFCSVIRPHTRRSSEGDRPTIKGPCNLHSRVQKYQNLGRNLRPPWRRTQPVHRPDSLTDITAVMFMDQNDNNYTSGVPRIGFVLCSLLTFWRRNYFLLLAHPVYKMWIIQEPNKLELWNKLHFKEEKPESINHV